jgi:nucleoside-diphosphate-sugar epimerase
VRIFGEGEEERDHIYVDDVAGLMAAMIRSRATGLYNLASGESRPFADVVKVIRGLVPYEVAVTRARLARAVPGFAFTPFDEGLRATLAAFGALGHA